VHSADSVRLAARQPALALPLRQVMKLPLQPFGVVVESRLELEEPAIAVVALRVVPGTGVVSKQVPIGRMAGNAADFLEQLFPAPHIAGEPAAGWRGMIEKIPFRHVEIAFADVLAVAVAVGVVHTDA